jgi:uncharacterized tellurite resistance protein B-like protein
MNKEEFANIYLKVALAAILADGEVAEEEIAALKKFNENEYYLSGYDLEDKIVQFETKFIARGYIVIKTILNELAYADISDSQKLILLNLSIQIVRADHVITLDEINFIKQLTTNLKIANFIVESNHPNWWLIDHSPGIDTVDKNQ